MDNRQNILLVLIAGLILWNVIGVGSIKTDVKSYRSQIEQLTTKLDSAQTVNMLIDRKVDSVKGKITLITKEINHIDNSITVIKKQTNEKVNSVDRFTANELEQFFADRYNKSNN